MEKFKGLSKDLYNRYRLDFCDFVEREPQLFSNLMTEMLMLLNAQQELGYQNYIGSASYEKNKFVLYEMVFRSYARIRLRYEARLQRVKDGEITTKEYLGLAKSKFGDNLTGFNKRTFRTIRDKKFACAVLNYFSPKGETGEDTEFFVAKKLSSFGPSHDEEYMQIFNRLSAVQQDDIFGKKVNEAIDKLETNSIKFKTENQNEPLEN